MFSQLFEERDRKVALLIKLGDCLGRSLRENVLLFSIDSLNQEVTYLTEGDKVISGHFKIGQDVTLNNLEVRDISIFEDTNKYDNFLTSKVHSLVAGVYGNNYTEADNQFSDLLSLWETRLKFDSIKNKLTEKVERVKFNTKIIDSDEFQRVMEVAPQIISFLKDNKAKFSLIPEIKNAVCLSDTVATAFNFPRLTYEQLAEAKTYRLKDGTSESIYEMICKQELIKKELVESRKAFSEVWATSPAIVKLAGLIFGTTEQIVEGLSVALKEVPYLAFASKKSLTETFTNCLDEAVGVSENEIRQFSSKVFEYKKEVRDVLTELLSEKYGVNLQNLKEPPSFVSLINTQILIFEAISRLAPTGGVIKKLFSELSESLKGKTGVESIDVNDFIAYLFESAEYGFIVEKTQSLNRYTKVDMKRLQKDIEDIHSTVSLLKGKLSDGEGGDPESGDGEDEGGEDFGGKKKVPGKEEAPGEKGGSEEGNEDFGSDEDSDDVVAEKPQLGERPKPGEAPAGKEKGKPGEVPEKGKPGEVPEKGKPGEVPEKGGEEPGEEGGEEGNGEIPGAEGETEEPSEETDIMGDLQDLEDMIDNLAAELGFGAEGEEENTLDTEKKTNTEKKHQDDTDIEDED